MYENYCDRSKKEIDQLDDHYPLISSQNEDISMPNILTYNMKNICTYKEEEDIEKLIEDKYKRFTYFLSEHIDCSIILLTELHPKILNHILDDDLFNLNFNKLTTDGDIFKSDFKYNSIHYKIIVTLEWQYKLSRYSSICTNFFDQIKCNAIIYKDSEYSIVPNSEKSIISKYEYLSIMCDLQSKFNNKKFRIVCSHYKQSFRFTFDNPEKVDLFDNLQRNQINNELKNNLENIDYIIYGGDLNSRLINEYLKSCIEDGNTNIDIERTGNNNAINFKYNYENVWTFKNLSKPINMTKYNNDFKICLQILANVGIFDVVPYELRVLIDLLKNSYFENINNFNFITDNHYDNLEQLFLDDKIYIFKKNNRWIDWTTKSKYKFLYFDSKYTKYKLKYINLKT